MIFLNEITITNKGGKLTVSSLQVAESFGKQHKHVLETIEELKKGVAENSADPMKLSNGITEKSVDLFIETTYQHPQNKQWYKCYDITRDGFSLLVMGFTGKKALEWKLKYIEAFNAMEQQLLNNNGLNVNLEELIAKTVTMSISETVKALIPLMKAPAQEIKELPSETKRIKKKYKHITPSKISMLEPKLKQQVNEMIISGEYSCQQIANYIMNNSDIEISQMSVNNYKRKNFIESDELQLTLF